MNLNKHVVNVNLLITINLLVRYTPEELVEQYKNYLVNNLNLGLTHYEYQVLEEYQVFYNEFYAELTNEKLCSIFYFEESFYNVIELYLKIKNTNTNNDVLKYIYDAWMIKENAKIENGIEETPFSNNDKWLLLNLINNYEEHLDELNKTIGKYYPLMIKALAKLNLLKSSIESTEQLFLKNDTLLKELFGEERKEINVVPLFSSPFGTLIQGDVVFRGVLIDYYLQSDPKVKINSNLQVLKAISDNTKFSILTSIVKESKYGAQLAKEIGLTPSTITHHLNELTLLNLTEPKPVSGKIYFVINRTTILNAMENIEDHLKLKKL